MGIKIECDLCKKTVEDKMDIIEIKIGDSGGSPKDVYGAAVCDACQKALDVHTFVHKFKSMGAQDLVAKQREMAAAEQRAQAVGQQPTGPVPVDPRVMAKIQGR